MNNIKKLRQNKNLTLIELANRLNNVYGHLNLKFSKATILRWEEGDTSPSIDHASALADFFGVTLDELAGRGEIQNQKDDYTLAAHIDDDVTEEELCEIQKYIDFIKSQRK